MRSAILAATIALTVPLTPTIAATKGPDYYNVQDLLRWCNSKADFERDTCMGYIAGASDLMTMTGGATLAFNDTFKDQGKTAGMLSVYSICPRDPVTYGASIQVFKNWAEKHPEKWGQPAIFGVWVALTEIWSCLPKQTQ
jgi:hypothetical protein